MLPSTNTRAKELAQAGAPHGTVVTAEQQTAGYGRHGRAWVSAQGKSITLSVVIRAVTDPMEAQKLTLAAAVAVCKAVEAMMPARPLIKWPNDLYLSGKKVCGILTEMGITGARVDWAVVGIGLNVLTQGNEFAPEVRETATSLALETGETTPLVPLAAALCVQFEQALQTWIREGFRPIAKAYGQRMALLGEWIRVSDMREEYAGRVEGVTPEGWLILRQENGQSRHILSGMVTVRKL